MVWKPHVTVSAVIENEGKFLVVEETVHGRNVFNNPAGHLEEAESLHDAIIREVQEETAYTFKPDAITGIYLWRSPTSDKTFLRVNFCGACNGHDPQQALDDGILRAVWLTGAELAVEAGRLRSPLVLRCIDDYLAGTRHPLTLLTHLDSDETPF